MALVRGAGRFTSISKHMPTGTNRWSSKREAEPPKVYTPPRHASDTSQPC
jgi:hypothetical protein